MRNYLRVLIFVTICMLLLAACGGGDDSDDAEPEAAAENNPVTAEVDEPVTEDDDTIEDTAEADVPTRVQTTVPPPVGGNPTLPPAVTATPTSTVDPNAATSTERPTRTPFPTSEPPPTFPPTVEGEDADDVETAALPENAGDQQLLFESSRDGVFGLYLTDSNGVVVSPVLNTGAFEGFPDVSPDGTQFAYMSDQDGNDEIYVGRFDGEFNIRITSDAGSDRSPRWSPDGNRIAFWSDRDGDFDVYYFDLRSSEIVRVTENNITDAYPVWTPNSSVIGMTSTVTGTESIIFLDLNTGDIQDTGVPGLLNDISADGTRVLLTVPDESDTSLREVFIMNVDGSGLTNLSQSPASRDEDARFSPDGLTVAFTSNRSGNAEIYLVPVNGGSAANITNSFGEDRKPAWLP